ncbi:site-specific integrase [Permianibacter sp. IMCC34836]|uniref:tyrosine-type recombinase/integrase n=1 Tax=Permianibacter fluminis TaxID=2738515 RepID=UPI001553148E|nr:site-specific integrase [Permianibacter fluminis]NQD38253.1 site-specific integrase [Permianibacter fluminis]
MFKVETVIAPSGERMLLLVHPETQQPLLLPLLYLSLQRRYVRFKTLRRDALALKLFYRWCYEVSHDVIDLELLLAQGQLPAPRQLEAFSRWLRVRTRYELTNDEAAIVLLSASAKPLTPETLQNYLGAIQAFLLWCLRRYLPPVPQLIHAGAIYEALDEQLQSLFKGMQVRGKSPVLVTGLDEDSVVALCALVRPDHPQNPFRPQLRLRNALIVELLLATGLRRGELLKLKTNDIGRDIEGSCFVRVAIHRDDPTDLRRNEPGQKTGPRVVAIPPVLYDSLIQYIQHERRPRRKGRPIKLSQTYLFLSERGRPLAEGQVNYLLQVLGKQLDCHVRPHQLRHTFCHNFLAYCTQEAGLTHESGQDQLRVLCGWSMTSTMPQRYTQKFLQEQADHHNLARQRIAKEAQ